MKKNLISLFGLGNLWPSGTWGSAGVAALHLVLLLLLDNTITAWIIAAVLALLGCVVSVWAGPWAVEHYKSKDPKPFVMDEAVGTWISVIALPNFRDHWLVPLVCAFFIWRVMDIIKPPPARQLEKLPHGWGILMDDVAAAVYANIVIQVVFRFVIS